MEIYNTKHSFIKGYRVIEDRRGRFYAQKRLFFIFWKTINEPGYKDGYGSFTHSVNRCVEHNDFYNKPTTRVVWGNNE